MMRCYVSTLLVSALLLDEMHPKNLFICIAPRVSPQYVPEKSISMLLAARSLHEVLSKTAEVERRKRCDSNSRGDYGEDLRPCARICLRDDAGCGDSSVTAPEDAAGAFVSVMRGRASACSGSECTHPTRALRRDLAALRLAPREKPF